MSMSGMSRANLSRAGMKLPDIDDGGDDREMSVQGGRPNKNPGAGGAGRTAAEAGADVLRWTRHPIRIAAMSMAALALAWGISSTLALVAAVVGAGLGVLVGELLGRSKFRTTVLVLSLALVIFLGWQVGRFTTYTTLFAATFGPGRALAAAAALRWFVVTSAVTSSLRLLAARRRGFLGIELAATAAAFATVFAGHRDGIVARPLWLSDWAWQAGIDPVNIFLAVGGGSVLLLAGLLVAESERRVSVVSVLTLPALALLAMIMLDVRGLPQPEAGNDLGLTDFEVGDPPLPTPEGGPAGGNGEGEQNDNKGEGEGDQQQQQGGQGGGEGDQQQEQGGGQGGQGEQQQEQQGGQGGQGEQQQDDGGGQGQQQEQQGQGGGQSQQQKEPDLDDMQPSDGSAPAPMAVVLLGDDYSPPSQAFYFRQEVWSHFNGSRLVAPNRPDVDLDVVRGFPATQVEVREPPPEAGRAEVHATVALVVEHKRPFALEGVVSMGPTPNPNPKRFIRSYEFVSRPQDIDYEGLFGHSAGNPEWSEETLAYYLKAPEDPRYAEKANELVEGIPEEFAGDPFAKALKVKLWMDENLAYSTKERHAGVDDPTADFLFGNQVGYCVHFAHAAVYMWRSLGIPARVGTGYHVDETARQGSAIVITGGNAHAWPELYLEGVGWVILDIAAAENLDPPGQPADQDMSELLADMARKKPDPKQEPEMGKAERSHFASDIGWSLLIGLCIAVVVGWVRKAWRQVLPRFAGPERLPKVAYRAMLDRLAAAGVSREYGETRERFARRVGDRFPSLARATQLHVAAAMAHPQNPQGVADRRPALDREAWSALRGQLAQELGTSVPVSRRLLGIFDPTSTLRSR